MKVNINFVKNTFLLLFFVQVFRLIYIRYFYSNISKEYGCGKVLNIENVRLRSKIVDVSGYLIAENKEVLSACCSPSCTLTKEFLDYINDNYGVTQERVMRSKGKHFCFIKRMLSQKEENDIKDKDFKEVFYIKEFERVYPYKFLMPVIGVVDIDSNGISGLEYYIDNIYQNLCFSDNSSYREFFDTNIDVGLSYKVYKIIKAACEVNHSEFAMGVVMDPSDGRILSMVQYPVSESSDLNNYYFRFSKPLAITEAYEMGSVIKAFCMLAAIDEKVVSPDEIIDCKNTKHVKIRGFDVNTWKANGEIPFKEVVKNSNNIGIVQVAMRLDKKLYDHYKKMGFESKAGIDLPGEAYGFMTPLNEWSLQTILSFSYGYEVSTTLMQLVRAWSLFTNNGKIIAPRLLKMTNKYETSEVYSADSINKARDILKYPEERIPKIYRFNFENIDLYGKTGTANILEGGVYQKDKNTFCFVGHIESGSWKRIIGVFINRSSAKKAYANTIAYPIFLKIANELIVRKAME
jgi:cell division protein FtsI (penicillin-binding protein 3)